ncbi:MBL fold metallo-hydrolase [Paenactinomyces guangxiensis]|uniref:MBL fold metallo-hydrolase n=1 Tax=Paenactinomyces guangxiensis TaxID=1490290 RepID=A0A7W1WNY3_9BACL|nr:MBL fold metallo-hydrolase [Paenactinomyces guangxiensis]MBA4493389.1 MBL fold metallo-hydrolase [Paenactinomyces guangxiensis]MBH8590479.1 MBL fold metallo-hydrolase [Paenactinomyces guangxiensis]
MNIMLTALCVLVVILVVIPISFVLFRSKRLPKPGDQESVKLLKPADWKEDEVTVGWVGHSTVFINLYGTKIMTDPVLGKRVGVHLFGENWQIGPKRHIPPALSLDDVGRVDLILLSHAHFDHFDIPSLKRLAHPDTQVVTPTGTSHLLKRLPFGKVTELSGEKSIQLEAGITITAVPVKHWGNRFPWNTNYGYTGYLIEKKDSRLFYPGDTAYTPEFSKLREAGEIDLAFMPIGAYQPYRWAHCTPEEAWQMFVDTGAKWLVPIHWNTFVLSYEPVDEPIKRLIEAAGTEADRIVLKRRGETFQFVKAYH